MKHGEEMYTGANAKFVFTSRFFNIFKLKSNFLKPALLTGFLFATFSVSAPALAATNIPSATYTSNYTWTKNNGPYIVNGFVYHRFGSLTIEPGTVIKFASATSTLTVHADVTLNALGTSAEPIYFTSIKDDSVGGDTNGDGNATSPIPGDWGYVSFGSGAVNSNMNIDYLKIRYGGGVSGKWGGLYSGDEIVSPALQIYFNHFSFPGRIYYLKNLEVSDSKTGMYLLVAPRNQVYLSDSSFHDNSEYAIYKWTGGTFEYPGPVFALNNWWGSVAGPYHSTLSPGGAITSKLPNGISFTPWLLGAPTWTEEIKKPDPVIIIPGILGSSEKNGEWVIDPIFHTYDDLIATLEANGYQKEKDLFTLPYDWKESNVLTALKLRDKINEVQTACQCDKVDLVAHSMGGLVARQYIQSDKYENDVDQLIFLGTPHLGAPKAYLMWEGGISGTGFSISDFLLNALLRQQAIEAGFFNVNSREILFNYIHNQVSPILSLQELLPVYSYLKDFDTGTLRNYPTNYPKNSFLENLNTSLSIKSLEQSGVNITNIFSDSQNDTIKSIRVTNDPSELPLWEHGVPKVFDNGGGDKTVPVESALLPNITNNINLSVVSEHAELPTSAEDKVIKILTNKLPVTTIVTTPAKKILSIFGLSPIDILVTAPDGKRIGKNFSTNQEVNEITGAFYSGFNTSNENIFIPNPIDGKYIVTTQGTGDGSYTILTDYIREEVSGEATSTVSNFTANTTIGREENLRLNFSSVVPENIAIVPVDDSPPSTTATVLGTQGVNNWYTSDVTVTLSAQDNNGGTRIFKTEYSIDNGVNWHTYSEPPVITKEGVTALLYRSQDFIGNMEESKLLEIKIDKTAPEARVYFDKENKTLKVEGVDNLSQTQIVQSDKTFIVQDEAGHTLKLIFNKLKQEGKEIKAELKSIQYNLQSTIQTGETNLKFEWSVDKKTNQIKELEQKIGVKNKFEIMAKFNSQKQNTKVKIETGTERNKQKYEETLEGLHIIKLITLSGELKFEF